MEAMWRAGLAVAPQPSWASGAAAPADHAFAPEGTRLYLGNEPDSAEEPYGVVFVRGDAVPVEDLCECLWEVPLGVALVLDGLSGEKADDYAAELAALFTGDQSEAGGAVAPVNWSTSVLSVNFVTGEMQTALREAESDAVAEVHFTIRCRFLKP